MRISGVVIVAVMVSLLASRSAPGPTPAKHSSCPLVWSDEFEGRRLDLQKWTVGNASQSNYDGGINIYAPQDVDVSNGDLVIRSRRISTAGKTTYSSGRVSTRNSYSFLYGKVEIRARLPRSKGLWPAIWMLRR